MRFSEWAKIGIDAGLEDVAARPFEQARIALLAQDRLVDLAGPLLLDDVGLDQLVADPHAEAGDRRVRAAAGSGRRLRARRSVWLTNDSSMTVRAIWSRMSTVTL